MEDNIYITLVKRIDEGFERFESYYPLLKHVIYVPLEGILKSTNNQIACKKGCSHCCSRIVVTTRVEVLALIDYILAFTDFDTHAIKEKVGIHSRMLADFLNARSQGKDENAIWFGRDIPCPFLTDGVCSVYEARPLSCRIYHSTDQAEKCKANVRDVGQLRMLEDAEALFKMVTFMIAEKVGKSLGVSGVLTIIMNDLFESIKV